MSEIAEYLQTLTADPASFMVSALVFLTVFAALSAAGLHFLSSKKPQPTNLASKSLVGSSPDRSIADASAGATLGQLFGSGRGPAREQPTAPGRGPATPNYGPRRVLRTIHRGLSMLMMAILVTVTIGIYFATDPDDGSRLPFWILAVVTLIAGLHFLKADDRIGDPEEHAAMRADMIRNVETDMAAKLGAALLGQTPVQWEIASPEVHTIDRETLARAQSMAAEGASVEEVCRSIERDYDQWTEPHRQAYRAVVSAALEHSG